MCYFLVVGGPLFRCLSFIFLSFLDYENYRPKDKKGIPKVDANKASDSKGTDLRFVVYNLSTKIDKTPIESFFVYTHFHSSNMWWFYFDVIAFYEHSSLTNLFNGKTIASQNITSFWCGVHSNRIEFSELFQTYVSYVNWDLSYAHR